MARESEMNRTIYRDFSKLADNLRCNCMKNFNTIFLSGYFNSKAEQGFVMSTQNHR